MTTIPNNVDESLDANLDPITGAPGAHPIGTGLGAAGGGGTGAVIGAIVGGPVGALVGAAVGSIAGGLAGKGAAEIANPTLEDGYWHEHYPSRPYASTGAPYSEFAPAYRYGWESQIKYAGRRFEEVEAALARGWDKARGTSTLAWSDARSATRDAWNRLESALPGDADHDGR